MLELDPRIENDTVPIGELSLCRVLLMNDHQYPWVILVPKVSDVTEIYQLSDPDRELLSEESNSVAQLMAEEFAADKMNVAALGNVVSQLHIHHIVRYKSDVAWPAPIWGHVPVVPYKENDLEKMFIRMKRVFKKIKGFK